jgi:glycosyltransferase involved in cell wall biosynthesis
MNSNEKLNICIVSYLFNNAFVTPLTNLEKIINCYSNNYHLIVGINRENLTSSYLFKGTPIIIFHKESKYLLVQIFHHILLNVKISIKIIQLSKKVDVFFFFMEEGSFLPILISYCLKKKSLWMLPSSLNIMIEYHPDIFSKILRFNQTLCFNLVDRIILYSSNLIPEWNLEKYKTKIELFSHHLIDHKRFKIIHPVNERSNTIGFIGRFSEEKGILNFINAIPGILKEYKNTEFLIIGDGDLKEKIETYLKKNKLRNNVNMTGWVSNEHLPEYYNSLKLLVIPSYTEGLPNVMLEAMACGTPVLATSTGSIPDIINDGKNGFLLQNNSPECLEKRILQILHFNNLDLIGSAAQTTIIEKFSLDNISKKSLDLSSIIQNI